MENVGRKLDQHTESASYAEEHTETKMTHQHMADLCVVLARQIEKLETQAKQSADQIAIYKEENEKLLLMLYIELEELLLQIREPLLRARLERKQS